MERRLKLFAFIITFRQTDSSPCHDPIHGTPFHLEIITKRDLFRIVQIIQAGIVQRIFYFIHPKTTIYRRFFQILWNRTFIIFRVIRICLHIHGKTLRSILTFCIIQSKFVVKTEFTLPIAQINIETQNIPSRLLHHPLSTVIA